MAMNAARARSALAALVLVAVPAAWTLAADRSDQDIRGRIEQRFAKAGLDQRADIVVSVEQGVARLTGLAVRYVDARDADRLARKEARSVVNLLQVVPEQPRSDGSIKGDAEHVVVRWERYGAFDAVGVDVRDGVVNIHGWVDTPVKRDEIEYRLAEVDGVRDVHNDLRLQGFAPGDVRLRQEIHAKIYRDPLFERYARMPDPPVRVFVERGRVTLAGAVGSSVEQVAVGHIARGTLAFAVDNQVKVETPAPEEDRKKGSSES